MLNTIIISLLLKENNIVVFNIDALLSLFDQSNITQIDDSPYHLAPELCKFLELKNPDEIYLWSYNGAFAPVVSYLQEKYNYNPEHTYWEPNPLKLLDYIRDTCKVSENNIAFVDYQSNRRLPYQAILSTTYYARIDPLDFLVESESRRYKEIKKYSSCYAKEFAECYLDAYWA